MRPTRSLGWRAVEAAVLSAFGYAVGFGLALSVTVGVVAFGVSAAERLGARHGREVALRHAALALALVAFAVLALQRGAGWVAAVAAPLAGWFLLDAVAQTRDGDRAESGGAAATAVDPDLAGELLRAVRAEPRTPAALAADLDLSRAHVDTALDDLHASGRLELDDTGRYRLASGQSAGPTSSSVDGLADRLRAPVRAFR